jgi:hypothetical protein
MSAWFWTMRHFMTSASELWSLRHLAVSWFKLKSIILCWKCVVCDMLYQLDLCSHDGLATIIYFCLVI